MPTPHRARAAAALALLCAVLTLLTLAWQSWIEPLIGAAPDHQDGSLERLLAALPLAAAIALAAIARAPRPALAKT